MFLDEARTVAALHHANIVQVYDVDMVDGHVFYVMEHLHSTSCIAMSLRTT
jgi:serine/threonine protein kinase